MVCANTEITFCGPCGVASRKEIEFRELGRYSVSCFSATKKLGATVAILFALIALTDPRFSQLTISHFVLIIFATFLPSDAKYTKVDFLSLLIFTSIVFCKIDQFERTKYRTFARVYQIYEGIQFR